MNALFYLNQTRFDRVLTDYRMPFIDACQLAEQTKNNTQERKSSS